MLNTPAWWYKHNAEGAPWWRFALWPLSLVWRAVGAIKAMTAKPYRSSLYVISVGNVTLGGSGKTPVTAMILGLLGNRAVGLSRGYGGSLDGPVLVDPHRHTAAEVGDEPLMLAQKHDFVIARDRAAGLRLIEAGNAQVAVVDDAHQNLTIAKDLNILVVDGDMRDGAWPFGDGGIAPYGPLREPFSEGLKRADLVVLWMPDETMTPDLDLLRLLAPKPVYIARLAAQKTATPGKVFGFAAIAKPWKFEATLRRLGYEVVEFEGFPDHAVLTPDQLDDLDARAEAQVARLITTEKDWVRLDTGWRERIACLPITARLDDEAGFAAALEKAISSRYS